MSDQEICKKSDEIEALHLFLEAYMDTTGKSLTLVECSERPDFICKRPDGTLVGVELTRVMRDPESTTCDLIMMRQDFRDAADASLAIWTTAEDKSRKLKAGNWCHADNTILVLQAMDCPLSEGNLPLRSVSALCWFLEDGSSPDDYADLGFSEVWVADYSELDAFRVIELFGLYPQRWWGYHQWHRGKPYG
jgi:hypothetical protein